jgi:hypothetical protein
LGKACHYIKARCTCQFLIQENPQSSTSQSVEVTQTDQSACPVDKVKSSIPFCLSAAFFESPDTSPNQAPGNDPLRTR